jgi:hypothetical protein
MSTSCPTSMIQIRDPYVAKILSLLGELPCLSMRRRTLENAKALADLYWSPRSQDTALTVAQDCEEASQPRETL